MKRRAFLASGVAVAAASAGCVGQLGGGNYDVAMVSDAFVPQSSATVPDDAPDWVPRDLPTVETTVGDAVIWENTGSRIHTVTAATREHHRAKELLGTADDDEPTPRLPDGAPYFDSGGFDDELAAVRSFIDELNGGGAIPPGERFGYAFEEPGWYHYYCIPHEPAGMMGNVHVLPD
ncbi:MAG: plastocyanin/azurin family copper-binding protein [Haloarculaceae archaeon]